MEFSWHLKGLEHVIFYYFFFFLQAVIWLFLGCEVFNISGFLMDAWRVPMINLLWLRVKRNLVFGTKAESEIIKRYKNPFRAGVFKAQVKCCRNELKQKCFQHKSSLISPPVFGTFDLWHSFKVNQLSLTELSLEKAFADTSLNDQQQLVFVCFATSNLILMTLQIQYFHCCLNRRRVNQILDWFSLVDPSSFCSCHAFVLWLFKMQRMIQETLTRCFFWAFVLRRSNCSVNYFSAQQRTKVVIWTPKRIRIMCVGLDPEVWISSTDVETFSPSNALFSSSLQTIVVVGQVNGWGDTLGTFLAWLRTDFISDNVREQIFKNPPTPPAHTLIPTTHAFA